MTVQAAGWKGAVETYVYEENGLDMFVVKLIPWQGSGGEYQTIARGRLDSTIPVKTFSTTMEDWVPPKAAWMENR